MNAASLNDIKKELSFLDAGILRDLCLRLARYKKENKELLTYLLFEAHDEPSFVKNVTEDIAKEFETVPARANSYFVKKSLRKILRMINRRVRYSARPETELECRLYFCARIREAGIPLPAGSVLENLYKNQVKKIHVLLARLPEDIRMDYGGELERLDA